MGIGLILCCFGRWSFALEGSDTYKEKKRQEKKEERDERERGREEGERKIARTK